MSQQELTLPQFINKANIPDLNRNFAFFLKQWPNFSNPSNFRFNPVLYRKIYPELASLNDGELCQYYFRDGLWYKPICSINALKKLLPDVNPETVTNLNEIVKKELLDVDTYALLPRYITMMKTNVSKDKYKLVVALQIGSTSHIAEELVTITKNIISSSSLLNTKDILLFVNFTNDISDGYDVIQFTEIPNIEYIITSSVNGGTDILPYMMTLNYLKSKNINTNYILKLHTKNDLSCIKQMTNCFLNGKIDKAISTMDAVPSIDILGAKDLVMPNYHVHDILRKYYPDPEKYNTLLFVAGSAFLSRFQIQLDVLYKYGELIKQSLMLCQYINGWFFASNSPTHALERMIGGFESQANGKSVKVWL
jgi:hypothetical protein